MNTCRNCNKGIPVSRLCFCTKCTSELLTSDERLDLMRPLPANLREETVARIVERLKGASTRVSRPPPKADAATAFRQAREMLRPILGRKT